MPQGHLNVTIDEKIFKLWQTYCKENDINSSKKLERILTEFLKKEGILKTKP